MVRLVAVGGGCGRVEGGEASVCRAHHSIGREAELRGAGAPLECALMVQSEGVDRGRAWGDCEGGHCVFPVHADIVVLVGDGVVDSGRVCLVYENDVLRN
jgi:hypothetical protein